MRGAIYDMLRRASSPKLRAAIKNSKWFVPVSQRIFGNEVYSESYYADIERLEGESVEHIAGWIVEHLGTGRMIDIGCGPGHLMAALKGLGVEPFGVDIASAAMKRCADKGMNAERFDLSAEGAELPGRPYDVAISCEVAEHLDERFADRFVEHLCSSADRVFLTAAVPNKDIGPGLYHVNEQPNEYWIEKMSTWGLRARRRSHGVGPLAVRRTRGDRLPRGADGVRPRIEIPASRRGVVDNRSVRDRYRRV